jgi:hypothetical protein
MSSCEIYGVSMRKSQRPWQPSTIILIWSIWQSEQYCEHVHESSHRPSCNCLSKHGVRSAPSAQGDSASCCRSAHSCERSILHVITIATDRSSKSVCSKQADLPSSPNQDPWPFVMQRRRHLEARVEVMLVNLAFERLLSSRCFTSLPPLARKKAAP